MNLKIDQDTCFEVNTPAIQIVGETLPAPTFSDEGVAIQEGLKLLRSITRDANGWRVKLEVTNTRSTPIKLLRLAPLEITSVFKSRNDPADTPEELRIFRLARQKNDIPGYFRPAVADHALLDALFTSEETSAGDGISADQLDLASSKLPHVFHSDPGMFIEKDAAADGPTVFVGFCGQSKHLSDVELLMDPERKKLTKITAYAEFDGVEIRPGESRENHELLLWSGTETELKDCYIDEIEKLYGSCMAPERNIFCSWYFYGPEVTEQDMLDNLRELEKSPLPIDVFQIDMGWDTAYGDWKVNEKFPHGLAFLAEQIRQAGFIPGIWTCPFIIEPNAEILNRYSDVRLKDSSGGYKIFKCIRGNCFIVDPFAESAREYFSELYGGLKAQGFTYHKLDFLRAVFVGRDCVFADPTKNRAEAYRHSLKMIREILGEDCLVNACGGLFEGSAGLCEFNRSGADNRGHWDGMGQHLSSYKVRIKQNIARNFYNRLWRTDPDALQIRRRTEAWKGSEKKHLSVSLFDDNEALLTVVNQFLGGGIACFSENLPELCKDRWELYWRLMPMEAPPARTFNCGDDYLPKFFATPFENPENGLPPWVVVTLANWNDDAKPHELTFRPSQAPGLPVAAEYAAFDFTTQSFLGIFGPNDNITRLVPERGCRVIRLTPLTGDDLLLVGTDLNLSCGTEILLKNAKYYPSEKLGRNAPDINLSLLKRKNGGNCIEKIIIYGNHE